MLTWLKELLWQKATFEQYARTALAGLWIAYESNWLPDELITGPFWYVTRLALVLAFMLRAGEKNPTTKPRARVRRVMTQPKSGRTAPMNRSRAARAVPVAQA
ncbi:MAG TPA: hypothetical protein VIH59_32880 [Candidatus Tectomicrobia bacterium]|jgi:hypothetical protein